MHKKIALRPRSRGFHLITDEVLSHLQLDHCEGVLMLFIQHSSASLTINENADPDVRLDMERWFLENVSDTTPYFEHTVEGPDDMPAHIKASLLGSSLCIPVIDGRLELGTWQGIWLGEHREHAGSRSVIATLIPPIK